MSVQQVASLSLSHSPVHLSFFSVTLFPSNRQGQSAGWRRTPSSWSMWLLLRSPPILLFWRDELDNPGMVPLTLLRHTSCSGEYQGRKSTILDFYYSKCILPLLFVFVQFIYLFGAKLFARVRIRVTCSYINKGGQLSLLESTTVHIETCISCCICSPIELLTGKGL